MKKSFWYILLVAALFSGAFFMSISTISAQEVQQIDCMAGECEDQGLGVAGLLENRGISFSLVVLAGVIDGTNPCAIGLLLLLLGSLLFFVKDERKMFRIGFAYIGAIFVTYFLIGVAFTHLLETILQWQYYQNVGLYVRYFLVALVWIAALINVKDVLQKDTEYTLDVTKNRLYKLMHRFIKIDWMSALGIGIVVTIFELPCSLPLYLGSIALLTDAFGATTTIWYLLLYSVMFIAPLVLLFALIVKSRHIFVAMHEHKKYKRLMKAIMALAQVAIGAGILLL